MAAQGTADPAGAASAAVIVERFRSTAAGSAAAVLVGGATGAGVAEVLDLAAEGLAAEGLVVRGACRPGLAAPHTPFAPIVAGCLAAASVPLEAPHVAALRRALPDIAALLPPPKVLPRVDTSIQRGHLVEGIAQIVAAAAAVTPVAIVIDDAHLAPPSTIALLRRLFEGDDAPSRVLLVLGSSASRTTGDGLAALSAMSRCERLEVAAPSGPAAITGVVASEVAGASAAGIAEAAALLGSGIDPAVVAAASGVDLATTEAGLRRLAAAGILVRAGSRFEFASGLARPTVIDSMSEERRQRQHLQLAYALELHAPARRVEIADHLLSGGALANLDRAVEAAIDAGDAAADVLAPEDGVVLCGRALALLDSSGRPEGQQRVDLLLALARLEADAGEHQRARETAEMCAALGSRLRRPVVQAEAALLAQAPYAMFDVGVVEEEVVALFDEALEALPADEEVLRARLLSALSYQYAASPTPRCIADTAQAVGIARASDDPHTLATALLTRHVCLLGPDHLPERSAIAAEQLALATDLNWGEGQIIAVMSDLLDSLQASDVEQAFAAAAAYAELASRIRHPLSDWIALVIKVMRSLLAGRLDEAEHTMFEALAFGRKVDAQNGAAVFFVQLFSSRVFQGRASELEDQMRAYVELYPEVAASRCALAYLYVEADRLDAAREHFDVAARHDFDDIAPDSNWMFGMTRAASVCHALGDVARAEVLHSRLMPYVGQSVVVGPAATCNGSVARFVGLLEATMGRLDDAIVHLDDALAIHRRMGARPYIAYTLVELAEVLLTRNGPGDEMRAAELVREAAEVATAVGMPALLLRMGAADDGE